MKKNVLQLLGRFSCQKGKNRVKIETQNRRKEARGMVEQLEEFKWSWDALPRGGVWKDGGLQRNCSCEASVPVKKEIHGEGGEQKERYLCMGCGKELKSG